MLCAAYSYPESYYATPTEALEELLSRCGFTAARNSIWWFGKLQNKDTKQKAD
jgi:hypothetical protein